MRRPLSTGSTDAGELPALGGQRPQLSVVVEGRALGEGRGAVTLPWTGAVVPVATVLRWGCDARLVPVWADPARLPLAVGRTSRTVTTAQRQALVVRDGGCVHPGCARSTAFCDAHHVVAWADGGPTDLANLVLLCRHHHRTLHAGDWGLDPDPHQPGRFRVTPARGPTRPAQTATDRSPPLRPTA